jgi:cell division protein FtsB
MREFQERRRLKKLLHSRYAIGILIILCGFLIHAVWSVYGKYERSKEMAERAKQELAELEVREKSLTASIADLNTDLGKERVIRERFGAVKEGERLIVLVDDENMDTTLPLPTSKNLWQKFISLFTRD